MFLYKIGHLATVQRGISGSGSKVTKKANLKRKKKIHVAMYHFVKHLSRVETPVKVGETGLFAI